MPQLPRRVMLGYAAGQFGSSLLPLVLISWILYFYSPPEGAALVLISPAVLGNIRLVERIVGAVFEPLVGHWSDGTKSRFGRRLPYIALGLPFLLASFVLIWFPPRAGGTDELPVIVHCAVALMVFFASYTVVVAPYVSLLPELVPDLGARVRVSIWMAVFDVLSNVVGALAAGALVAAGAVSLGVVRLDDGYQLLGVVMGTLGLLSFVPVLLLVREAPRVNERAVPYSFRQSIAESFKNPEFVPYAFGVSGFRFATTCAVVGLPFMATQLMGASEELAGALLAVIIVVATTLFPVVERLSRRHGKARVFRWGALGYVLVLPLMGTIGLGPLPPMLHGVLLFALSGFSTATVFVLPRAMLADVIDLDQTRTGFRREAMYNGMSGVLEKVGEALGTGTVGWLFAGFGNSSAHSLGLRLVGIGAALGLGLSMLVFRRYSLES